MAQDQQWVFEMPDQPAGIPSYYPTQQAGYPPPPPSPHQQQSPQMHQHNMQPPAMPQIQPQSLHLMQSHMQPLHMQAQMLPQLQPPMQSPMQSQMPPHIPPQVAPVGALMFADPMMAAAMTRGQDFVYSSNSWIDKNLKPYFAVDDKYVIQKLAYLLFPFRSWKSQIGKPDLYIPMMSFITYVLSAGYILGVRNEFNPEKLGMLSTSALFCVGFEVVMMVILFATFNTSIPFGFCVAFSGYKFVPIIWVMFVSIFFKSTGYYIAVSYLTISLGYFLIRSCHLATVEKADDGHRKGLYLAAVFCLLQPLFIFWLTYSLV